MSELTTSRINRQLRSLRSKCAALKTSTPSAPKPAVSVTYGKNAPKRIPEHEDTPPLAILQSLDKFSIRLHFDRAIVDTMQLSKRIYEVRDAFKHIVQSSFTPHMAKGEQPRNVLSLTGICARVVGETIQSEVEALTGEAERHAEDELRTQAMDDLYEQVPVSFRHYTLVAHALTYILDTCPHHPTLLNSLLEVCVAHNLFPEARSILSALCMVCILPRPNPTSPCPLTHPAHKNFLTTLRDTCAGSGSTPFINNCTFTHVLVDALSQPCAEQLQAWTSKAVAKLARDFRKRDLAGCFVPLCVALAHILVQRTSTKRRPAAKNVDDHPFKIRDGALERLTKWVVSMLDTLHASNSATFGTEEHQACVDFLVEVESLRFHVNVAPATSPMSCLVDALCCLAAHCLASPLAPPITAVDSDYATIERLLRSAHTTHDTFDGLVSCAFPHPSVSVYRVDSWEVEKDTPTPPPGALIMNGGGLGAIDSLAHSLRTRNLLRCEAFLYHQTLRHVEDLISAPAHAIPPEHQLSEKGFYELRTQLMDRVEDAERRCYGGVSAGVSQLPSAGGAWEWEEMVASWVLKSPAPARSNATKDFQVDRAGKRRRVGHPEQIVRVESLLSGCRVDGPRKDILRRSDARVSSNESSDGSIVPYAGPGGSGKRKSSSVTSHPACSTTPLQDKENSDAEDLRPEDSRTPAPRRMQNFATILADAQMNVISLRAEREAKAQAKSRPKYRVSAHAGAFAKPESSVFLSARARHAPQQIQRRQSSFATAMADSHRNVISLRAERERERQLAAAAQKVRQVDERKRPSYLYGRRSSDSKDEGCGSKCLGDPQVDPESSPVRARMVAEPSSDDALNLFAYPDSSPVTTRRCVLH